MIDLICRKKNKNGSCLLAFIIKILLIVIVAELVIYLYGLLVGMDANIEDLVKSILRLLLVAAGIFFIFGRKNGSQEAVESVGDELDPENIEEDVKEDELKQWPNIDPLTRTSNERGLTISILELMALADRYGHKLSIGLIKIDGIDSLEETDAGDVMINTAGLMTESLRMPDRIGRFRDNMFMALLPESDIAGATIVADRLRENLEKGMTNTTHRVSVWIGMTEFHRGEDLQSFLDRVELAVAQSEKEKNSICIKP
ncbi:MAG: diguanylate cyclase [Gammaproteobacteria bacterium]|nr:diguanylate cyclase [Gammaproteobacteria bacterium]